jgi:regulator of nucleoside diphosphate kinase
MNPVKMGERRLTESDFSRLHQLAVASRNPVLEQLLSEAEVLEGPQVPGDVVKMHAQVEVQDVPTQRRHRFVLCYPGNTEPRDGHISVLSPVGLALIGLNTGALASWRSPTGDECAARVVSVARHAAGC